MELKELLTTLQEHGVIEFEGFNFKVKMIVSNNIKQMEVELPVSNKEKEPTDEDLLFWSSK